jgi:hypothetical protein
MTIDSTDPLTWAMDAEQVEFIWTDPRGLREQAVV